MFSLSSKYYDLIYHQCKLTENSLLKDIYNQSSITINSVHHQGIKTLGKNLVVDAICAEDNLVEAFHYHDMDQNYVLAVQWHPEFSHTLGNNVNNSKPIYEHFLNRISKMEKNK